MGSGEIAGKLPAGTWIKSLGTLICWNVSGLVSFYQVEGQFGSSGGVAIMLFKLKEIRWQYDLGLQEYTRLASQTSAEQV